MDVVDEHFVHFAGCHPSTFAAGSFFRIQISGRVARGRSPGDDKRTGVGNGDAGLQFSAFVGADWLGLVAIVEGESSADDLAVGARLALSGLCGQIFGE